MRAVLVLALLASLLVPLASAQEPVPVLVEDLDATYAPREVATDEPVELRWRVLNLNRQTPFYVHVGAPSLAGWDVETPERFFLQPLANRTVVVTLRAQAEVPERIEFPVTFTIVNSDTGAVATLEREVLLVAPAAARVFDTFPNPLPPPLDNAYGIFAIEMAVWVLVAVAAMLVGDRLVRALASRAPSATVGAMVSRLRRPVFLAFLFLGIARSFETLPGARGAETAARLLDALVIVLVAYVGYQVVSAALTYYSSTLANRTETRIDDVLVPVLRKVAAVVVAVMAVAFVLQLYGLSANVVFGAAGIAGLVIAFAAQDTLSNFFSGVFLLLDRPFEEGDEIIIETGEVCRVQHIGLRSTRLYHGRHHEVIVLPNNQLATRRVVNTVKPDRRYRVVVEASAAYGTDPAKVRAALMRVGRSHPEVIDDPDLPMLTFFTKLGESSIDFILICAVRNAGDRWRVGQELREMILREFTEQGIVIPFPHRTVILQEPGRG